MIASCRIMPDIAAISSEITSEISSEITSTATGEAAAADCVPTAAADATAA
jgi:hypothetical protein